MKIVQYRIAAIVVTLAWLGAVAPVSRMSGQPAGALAAGARTTTPGTIRQAPLASAKTFGGDPRGVSGWPQPGYDATNTGFNPNEHTISASNVATLRQVWHHGGDGTYSDPVVGNGDLALTTRAGGRCSGIEVLSPTSGKLVWSARVKAFECTNPVLSGGTLLMVTNNPWKLYAWNLSNGRRVQMKTLGHTRFSGITLGQDRPVFLSSGRARSTRPDRGRRNGDIPLVPYLFVNGANGWVKSFAPAGGKQIWAFNTHSTLIDSRPVLYGGNAYVVSMRGTVFAIGAVHGRLSWKRSISITSSLAKLAVADGKLFVSSGPDILYAVNISNANPKTRGTVVWKVIGMGYNTDFAVAYHELFITSGPQGPQGQGPSVFALNDGNGQELWGFTTGYGGVKPSVANGIVYVSNDGVGTASRLFAIDANTGEELWSVPGAGSYPSYPAIAGGRLYLSNYAFGMTPGSQNKPPLGASAQPTNNLPRRCLLCVHLGVLRGWAEGHDRKDG